MMTPTLDHLIVRHAAARFAGQTGYRLEGDAAVLQADIAPVSAEASQEAWALQLWATDGQGTDQPAVKVAELPLDLNHNTPIHVAASTLALPPAGATAHTMVLTLASGSNGCYDRIHDLSVFPCTEQFSQPRLGGQVGFHQQGARVELRVEEIFNPRAADNRSGTLALELWALDAPYGGGAFSGHRLALATLDSLDGQQQLRDLVLSTPAEPVPAGQWQLCLMLREWTAIGYVTRDFSNFPLPLDVPAVTADQRDEPAAPAAAAPAAAAPAAAAPAAAAPAAAAPAAAAPAAAAPAAAAPAAAPVAAPAAAPVAATPAAQQTATSISKKGKSRHKDAPAARTVSVNQADVATLCAVKGLSKPLATAIIAARPFASLDDLGRVKGMGAKTLLKLLPLLSL